MSVRIFENEAPKWWEGKFSVVPVEPGTKQPAKGLTGWQGYAAALPNEEKRQELLIKYSNCNIGLMLDSWRIVAFDIDDDALVPGISRYLSLNQPARQFTISGKKGMKGATIFAVVADGEAIKSATLKGAVGLGNIDLLASGKMTVMPPSVHPDTGLPYEYVGVPLLEMPPDKLPIVRQDDIFALKAAIGSEHIHAIMAGETTHDAGVSLSAALVATGASDETINAIFVSFLPKSYEGNSLKELPGWIASAREKGFGDEKNDTRGTMTAALAKLGTEGGVQLFKDGDTAYATVPTEKGFITVRILSEAFKRWLRHTGYQALDKPPTTGPLLEAIAQIESMALFDGASLPTYRRVGGGIEHIEIDLGREDGYVVSVTKNGWSVEAVSRHKFVRGSGFGQLPDPVKADGKGLAALRRLLSLDEMTFLLLVAFLLNALKPGGPFSSS